MEINRNRAHLQRYYMESDYQILILPPGGWLVAVTVEIDRSRTLVWSEGVDRNNPLHVEITDSSGAPLFGGFDINHHLGYHQGGIVLDEPIPNISAANPYNVLINEAHPPLVVHSLNCWHLP